MPLGSPWRARWLRDNATRKTCPGCSTSRRLPNAESEQHTIVERPHSHRLESGAAAGNDFVTLNRGVPGHHATRGVIAAGTGLGEALLFWDGEKYRVAPAEGGQADFAPRTDREMQLLSHLRLQLPHVSCEEIVSGRGFRRIHEFLDPSVRHASFESQEGNAASEITQRGLAKSCAVCEETLDFWTEIYGATTGNFVLHTMAVGGVYIAGGIATKILPKLQEGAFFKVFCGAGKLAAVLARVPI